MTFFLSTIVNNNKLNKQTKDKKITKQPNKPTTTKQKQKQTNKQQKITESSNNFITIEDTWFYKLVTIFKSDVCWLIQTSSMLIHRGRFSKDWIILWYATLPRHWTGTRGHTDSIIYDPILSKLLSVGQHEEVWINQHQSSLWRWSPTRMAESVRSAKK